jgi:predicted nucleic acid-binding protein
MNTRVSDVRSCDQTQPNEHGWKRSATNLTARIAEAQREGWLGEVEGLQVSLAGAEDKLAQLDRRARNTAVNLGVPVFTGNR